MELFALIWCSVGGIFWLGMMIFDKDDESSSIFFGVIAVIAGPLILLFVGISELSDAAKKPSVSTASKPQSPPKPPKTTTELEAEYSELITLLNRAFILSGTNSPISKGLIASAQRLGALARKTALKAKVDKEQVLQILQAALSSIDMVYGGSITGSNRREAIQTHIQVLSGTKAAPSGSKKHASGSKRNKSGTSDSFGFNIRKDSVGPETEDTTAPETMSLDGSDQHAADGEADTRKHASVKQKEESKIEPKKGKISVNIKY